MSDPELCYLTAAEAMALFVARELSPLELMRAVIARAEDVEPKINAFSFRHYEEALDLAESAERRFMKRSADIRPFEGLPVTVKDTAFIKGKPTSCASKSMKDYIADFTSPFVERVLQAGAIVHARSTVPEFASAAYCNSPLWGVTRNPWNPDYTPGGSSGGAGASLAAGTSLLATGSDIGGSIRIPASCSGVVGYKPPWGRNPVDPPFNLDFYCHTGPMTRSLADCIMMQNVMCGPHPQDISTLRPKLILPNEYQPIKGWKIAYSLDLGFFEVDPTVIANTRKALKVFEDLGAEVEEVDLGWDWSVLEAALTHLDHLAGTSVSLAIKGQEEEISDYAFELAQNSRKSSAEDFYHSLEKATEIYSQFGPLMDRFNLFICPTTAIPAVPANFNQVRDELRINGLKVNSQLGWAMTFPFNMMSRLPVLSVPSGHAPSGVPTGIQLVGRTYCDQDVFQAGMAYENALGGWYREKTTRPEL